MSNVKFKKLDKTLKQLLKEDAENSSVESVVALSRFKTTVTIPIRANAAIGQQSGVLLIPSSLPTPITEQYSLQVLANSIELNRYIAQDVLILVDPASVPKLFLNQARDEVASITNSHVLTENDLLNTDEIMSGEAKTHEEQVEHGKEMQEAVGRINTLVTADRMEEAKSELVGLISADLDNVDAILELVDNKDLAEEIRKQL